MNRKHALLAALTAATVMAACLAAARPPFAAADVGPCLMFPDDNIWNTRVDNLPVDARSAAYIQSIGPGTGLHPDFGAGQWAGGPIGIPYTTVPGTQAMVPITWTAYGNQSDPGPYPIPANAPIEGGSSSTGDRHVLVVDVGHCKLYELYRAFPNQGGGWNADSGAIYDLNAHTLRPAGWTSADAAGLPILPGLARFDEVASGEIRHALRFTADDTQGNYIWPARHEASDITDLDVPPMGQRFRLKASFNISGYSPQVQVLLTAMKVYGIILADNGSNWYITGAPDAGWDDETLVDELSTVEGSDFEAVDESGLMISANSGQALSLSQYQVFIPFLVR